MFISISMTAAGAASAWVLGLLLPRANHLGLMDHAVLAAVMAVEAADG